MIVSALEAKTFIGIEGSDTEFDVEIEALIPDAESMLFSALWVKTLEQGTRKEWCMYDEASGVLTTPDLNITAIAKISTYPYGGTLDDDFIVKGKTIQFMDGTPEELEYKRDKVLVEYTAGYPVAGDPAVSAAPDNLKLALKYLISGLWNTKKDIGVSQCKIGQESYTFTSFTDQSDFLKIVKEFKKTPIAIIL